MDLIRKKITRKPQISSPSLNITKNPVSGKVEGIPLDWVKLMDANISKEEQNVNLDAAVNAVRFYHETISKSFTQPHKLVELEGARSRMSVDSESSCLKRHSRSLPSTPTNFREFKAFDRDASTSKDSIERMKLDDSLRLLALSVDPAKKKKEEGETRVSTDDEVTLRSDSNTSSSNYDEEYWLNLFDETFDIKTIAIALVLIYLVSALLVTLDIFPFFQCRK